MSAEAIRAKFFLTKHFMTVYVTFHEVTVQIRWKRTDDAPRHLKTLSSNLEEIIREGMQEIFVQDQANRLDWEIEDLFRESDEDRPHEN